ncbi:MAG: hypothetical protein GY722_17735, partial [bacterium]|nr:hypothetical protein [bacterium]
MAREIRALGKIAQGPGHYALGEAALSLGELEDARRNLEISWRSGFRESQVALALGQAYGRLYRQAVVETRYLKPAMRDRETASLREELLAPANDYFRLGLDAGALDDPYLSALQAFYEEDFKRAELLIRQAL